MAAPVKLAVAPLFDAFDLGRVASAATQLVAPVGTRRRLVADAAAGAGRADFVVALAVVGRLVDVHQVVFGEMADVVAGASALLRSLCLRSQIKRALTCERKEALIVPKMNQIVLMVSTGNYARCLDTYRTLACSDFLPCCWRDFGSSSALPDFGNNN